MKKKLLLPIFITSSVVLPAISFSITSCDNTDNYGYKIDGTDWQGVKEGCFVEGSYEINNEAKTVTYLTSFSVCSLNLVIPNYVNVDGNLYRVVLGAGCFSNNLNIVGSVEFNDFLFSVPNSCFEGCQRLTSIIFHNYPKTIGVASFNNCILLDNVYVKRNGYITTNWLIDIEKIENLAFSECRIIGELVFSKNLTLLGDSAFKHCSAIKKIDLSNCVSLGEIHQDCFSSCTVLTQVSLNKKLSKIDSNAFMGCTLLREVQIPDENMELEFGESAFCECLSLIHFTKKFKIKSLSKKSFAQCPALRDELWDKDYGVKLIPEQCFEGCGYNRITFHPDPINKLKVYEKAFAGCQNLIEIDFHYFPVHDCPTTTDWIGTQIFGSLPSTGVVYLSGDDTSHTWQTFLETLGLTFGNDNWKFKIRN